jgi:hypothetical protein
MEAITDWRLRQAEAVEIERVLPGGKGTVRVAVDDPVEPDQPIVQGPQGVMLAGLRGRVRRVIPERGVVISGVATVIDAIAGLGVPVVGPLAFAPAFTPGCIAVSSGELTVDLVRQAVNARAVGLIAASAPPEVIEQVTGTECSSLLDGSVPPATPPPLSLVLVHGFGHRSLRPEVAPVLGAHAGQIALVSPVTVIQHGVRPHIVLPLPWQAAPHMSFDPTLIPGALVWVLGGDFDGATGRVARLLHSSQIVPSGIRAPAARVRLENGAEVTLPLANLQRVG